MLAWLRSRRQAVYAFDLYPEPERQRNNVAFFQHATHMNMNFWNLLARATTTCMLMSALLVPASTLANTNDPIQVVHVNGLTDVDERSYAGILRGMDLFEQRRAMAPNAELRFELQPIRARTVMKNIKLQVTDGSTSIPVTLADDMSFTVPRLANMPVARAQLRSNRRKDTLLWRARIRTPGLPPNTRRLGDLRLEWHVDYVSNLGPHWISPGSKVMMAMMERPYEIKGLQHLFLADRPLFGVTMIAGARRHVLSSDMLFMTEMNNALPAFLLSLWKDREFIKDRAFDLPLSDASWPDDTLVVFDHMDDMTSASSAPTASEASQ